MVISEENGVPVRTAEKMAALREMVREMLRGTAVCRQAGAVQNPEAGTEWIRRPLAHSERPGECPE